MNCPPLVSIYITTFNRIDLLKRAIRSVLNQDYTNIEVIVVDDCSKDGTQEYLRHIEKLDNRIRFFANDNNYGACKSRNVAIENAKGEFITGLDDDDLFLPNRVSEFLERWKYIKPSTVALSSSIIIQSPNGKKILRRPQFVKKTHLIDNGNFVGAQVFTRTEYLKKIGGFDERMPIMQDFECWLRLLDISSGASIETTRKETYVVDVSHPHTRISHNRSGKLAQAHEIVFSKHAFSALERRIMLIDIDIETHKIVSPILFIKKIIRNPMLYNIQGTLGLILRNYLFDRR